MKTDDKSPDLPDIAIDMEDEGEETYERMSVFEIVEDNPIVSEAAPERASAEVSSLLSQWLLAFSTGEYEGAIAAAAEASQLMPEDLSIRCKLATGYLMAGRYPEASDTLDFILTKDPDHEEARGLADSRELLSFLLREAREALKKREFDRSGAIVERAIRLIPTYPDSYVLRAIIHYQAGRREDCMKDLEKALELHPHHEQARKLLEEIGKT